MYEDGVGQMRDTDVMMVRMGSKLPTSGPELRPGQHLRPGPRLARSCPRCATSLRESPAIKKAWIDQRIRRCGQCGLAVAITPPVLFRSSLWILARVIGIPLIMAFACRLIADIAMSIAREQTGPDWLPFIALAAGGGAGLLGGLFAGLVSARASVRDALFGWLAISSVAGLLILLTDVPSQDGRLLLLVVAVVLTGNLGFAIPGVLGAIRVRRARSEAWLRPNGARS